MTLGRARTELATFVDLLKGARTRAGEPSTRDLERLTEDDERPLTRQTITNKLKLRSVPEWIFVDTFLAGCERYAETDGTELDPSDEDVAEDGGRLIFDRGWWDARHDRTMAIVEQQHEDNHFAAMAKAERDRRLLPRQLPPPTSRFTGRDRELSRLDELLDEDGGKCVVHGTAGVGKTALAVHWAHRVANRFPGGQLYVNLQGFDPGGVPVPPALALRGFLDAFGVPQDRLPGTTEEQAKLFRSLVAGRAVLVILDNAASVAQVRLLLPGSPTCRVVITSRDPLTGLAVREGATALKIEPFPAGDAEALVARHVRDERVGREPAAVAGIARLCAYLPLAIGVVAARAQSRPELRLADVVAELTDESSALTAMQTGDDIESNVRAAFSWSYRYLYGPAARLFRSLAAHPGPDFTVAAAAGLFAVDVPVARTLLDELAGVQLIEEHTRGRFSFHDLLRLYATELGRDLDTATDRSAARERTHEHYLHSAHAAAMAWDPLRDPLELSGPVPGVRAEAIAGRRAALSWLNAEYAVLLAVARQAARRDDEARSWRIAWCLADFINRQGHWGDGEGLVRTALAAAERIGDQAGQARLQRVLGRREAAQGAVEDGRQRLAAALAFFTATGDFAGQAHVHIDFALLCGDAAAAALDHAEQALACYRTAGSAQGEGNALNAVGWFQAQLGDLPAALVSCTAALRILEPLDDVAGLGATLDSLGHILGKMRDHEKVDRYYRQALALFVRSDDPRMQADTLEHIGENLLAAGRPAEARAAFEQAAPLFEQAEAYDRAEAVRNRLDEAA